MTDKTIIQLTELAEVDLNLNDVIAIADVSASITYKIRLQRLIAKLLGGGILSSLGDVNATHSAGNVIFSDGDSWESSDRLAILLGSLSGQSGKVIAVKATEDGFELITPSGGGGGSVTLGKAYIGNWSASAMKPTTSNGAGEPSFDEVGTNKVMVGYMPFDAATVEYAQFSFKSPSVLNETEGYFAIFEWKEAIGATTHDCVWKIEMQAQSDADAIDVAWGTGVTVIDTGSSGTRRFTAETTKITPAGSWATGDEIIARVSRLATDGSDTLDVDAQLISVTLFAIQDSLVEA